MLAAPGKTGASGLLARPALPAPGGIEPVCGSVGPPGPVCPGTGALGGVEPVCGSVGPPECGSAVWADRVAPGAGPCTGGAGSCCCGSGLCAGAGTGCCCAAGRACARAVQVPPAVPAAVRAADGRAALALAQERARARGAARAVVPVPVAALVRAVLARAVERVAAGAGTDRHRRTATPPPPNGPPPNPPPPDPWPGWGGFGACVLGDECAIPLMGKCCRGRHGQRPDNAGQLIHQMFNVFRLAGA